MTSKRDPAEVSFFHQPGESENPSTLRSIEVAEEIAADVEELQPPVYVEPQPPARLSDHKTIEVETVKLAEDIDPRKLPTELRLARPPSLAPDPGALHELASHTPPLQRGRWRVPLVLGVVFAALLLLAFARAMTRASRPAQVVAATNEAAPPDPVAARPSAEPAVPAVALAPGAEPVAPPAGAEPVVPPAATVAAAPAAEHDESATPIDSEVRTKKHSNSHPTPKSSAPAAANSHASDRARPKRAIY